MCAFLLPAIPKNLEWEAFSIDGAPGILGTIASPVIVLLEELVAETFPATADP
jgi:hypothetical protein